MKKLKLETSYKVNGNSTGAPIDTLSIAVDGRDQNGIDNFEGESETEKYVLEHYDYESDMLKEATKEQLKAWLDDPAAQAAALKEYEDVRKEAIYSREDEESELAKEVEKAIGEYRDDCYKEWIYGSRDWPGILSMASKRYGRDIEFSTEKGEVFAEIPDEVIADWKEEGSIDRKAQAYGHLANLINNDAENEYHKRKQENEKRRAENERVRAYKEGQAKEKEIARQNKIKALIKTK